MKINKRRPTHWLLLCGYFVTGLTGLLVRFTIRRKTRKLVLFYGHKLNGNLLAIFCKLSTLPDHELVPIFLTMDRAYCRKLQKDGFHSVWACRPKAIWSLARADALISDHGLHSLQLLLRAYQKQDLRFFDIWHGIPFKGFDADDFRLQHRYDEVWVASPLMKKLYVNRYGFDPNKVIVTGYARTDRLVRQDEDTEAIKRDLGLDGAEVGKIVLFAPTWKQGKRQRSIYPFDTDEHTFLQALSRVAQRTQSTIVMRTHLNSGGLTTGTWPRIVQRPFADYPDTEALLLITDVLVCDWSSIAFDYLLLERPTIFLDVEPPFAKGFSLGIEYRYGDVAADMGDLKNKLEQYLKQPSVYQEHFKVKTKQLWRDVYGGYADGIVTQRCVERLIHSPAGVGK